MVTLLIADDEELIRKGIIAILKNALKTDVTYLEAENGLEALKICRDHYPEIIVSDIRMPFCSGLKFIEKVKGLGYSPYFIIISGYSEFEYAKQAIKYGVKDYVLKPIQKKQFVQLIQSCLDEIAKKKADMHEEHVSSQTNEKAMKAIRKKLLLDLLNCSDENQINKITNIGKRGVLLNSNFALCCTVQYKTDKSNSDYIDLAVINILEEILTQENLSPNAAIETYSCGQTALIFEGCNSQPALNLIAAAISKSLQSIKGCLKIDVFAGIGDVQFGATRLYKSFHHACQAANYKLYQSGSNIQKYKNHPSSEDDFIHFETVFHSLEQVNPSDIVHHFDRLIYEKPSIHAACLIEKSYENLVKTVQECLKKYDFIDMQDIPAPTQFHNFWSFMQLKYGIENYLIQIKEVIKDANMESESSRNKLIENIMDYIRDNAASGINLNSVSNHFSYTPSYISFLFKKHIGIGFNEFVTKIRMDMAKNMLKNSTISIGEISKLCGYDNAKYFATSFKKNFGISPSVFRQN